PECDQHRPCCATTLYFPPMSVTAETPYGRSVIRTDPMGSFVPPRTTVPVMETRAAAREVGSGVRCWIGMPRNKNKRQICLIMIVSYIDNRTRSMVRFSHPLLGCVPSHRL